MFNKMSRVFLGVFILCLSFTVSAFEKQPFTKETFAKLQAAGEVVMVDVYAPWCPTCDAQQAIFKRYSKQYPDNKFHVLIIDFGKDKDLVAEYGAPRQSSLYLFKGEKRVWSAVAEKDYNVVKSALNSAF